MPGQLGLKDYLETITESSKRVRFTTIVLVVVTVLIIAGNLSIGDLSWMDNRLAKREEQNYKIGKKIEELKLPGNPEDAKRAEGIDFLLPTTCVGQDCDADFPDCVNAENKSLCKEQKRLECYNCAKKVSDEYIPLVRSSRVENYTFKVPFFGVSFDSNDLTLLGGFSLIIVLTMLRLGLRNYIVSLRIGIKAALQSEESKEFYDILASRQLFVFPYLEDENQAVSYIGKTERLWKDSKLRDYFIALKVSIFEFKKYIKTISWKYLNSLFALKVRKKNETFGIVPTVLLSLCFVIAFFLGFVVGVFQFIGILLCLIFLSFVLFTILGRIYGFPEDMENEVPMLSLQNSNNKGYWSVNPQPWLKRIPRLFSLIPCFVYFISFVRDYRTLPFGLAINFGRTAAGFVLCLIFLFILFGLGFWCVSKWSEIDELWQEFYVKTYKNTKN
ncbi:MAG TPA: hypothetical protein VF721_11660 [Pyrinomonadaceae bacterium]|jgi:hypothetical protein